MHSTNTCPQCGAPLSEVTLEGMCPQCVRLLVAGFDVSPEEDEEGQVIIPEESAPVAGEDRVGGQIGRYRLLERIGEGGFGVVYRAEQVEPVKREVALKILKLGMDTRQVVGRFESERQALALMAHEGIAKVHDAGATGSGRPYFVMELIRGLPITSFCQQHQLTTRERLDLFVRVCQAMQHAHLKGIIHRDLKPSNILVEQAAAGGFGIPKVIDFGIAKATRMELTEKTVYTQLSQFVGTPAYVSPEQVMPGAADVDTRSDIYSLGVLLYEMLTGMTPFDANELRQFGYTEMSRRIREVDPPTPSARVSRLNQRDAARIARSQHTCPERLAVALRGDLDWVVMKSLEKSPARRYQSALEFARDIECVLHEKPVSAVAPSTGYRLRKYVRRNRVFLGVTGLIMTLLVTGTVVSWRQALRASQAQGRELAQRIAAQEALFNLRFRSAERLIQSGDSSAGFAYLARLVRDHPTNQIAAQRLTSILTERSFALPTPVPGLDPASCQYAAFSPDGSRFAVVFTNQSVSVLAVRDGSVVSTLPASSNVVQHVVFSPGGQWLVTTASLTVRVWETETGRPVSPDFHHATNLWATKITHNDRWLCVVSKDYRLQLWDLKTGTAVPNPILHQDEIFEFNLSPDGKRLATASFDGTARVWDPVTGEALMKPIKHDGRIYAARWSPDGTRLATGCSDGGVRVWDAISGELLNDNMRHRGTAMIVRFSPDGRWLLTSSADATARIWEARTGLPITEPLRHAGRVYDAEFSPDGLRVVTGSSDRTARVWDAMTGRALTEPMPHAAPLEHVQFHPDGSKVMTLTQDYEACTWDVRPGQALRESIRHGSEVYTARFDPTGDRMVVCGTDGLAQVWDVCNRRPVSPELRHRRNVCFAVFSPDGRRVLTASFDATAAVWDAATGQKMAEFLGHTEPLRWASFSPDGKKVVTGSTSGSVRLWDSFTGQAVCEPLGHSTWVTPNHPAQFTSDGKLLLTASMDGTAQVWDTLRGMPVGQPIRHTLGIYSALFSADGSRIVTASHDKTARIWDSSTSLPLTKPLTHNGAVTYAEFSPDGRKVLTASEDQTVRIWDAETGQPLCEPLQHGARVNAARFSPDGSRLVIGSQDGWGRVWDVETGLPVGERFSFSTGIGDVEFSPDGRWISVVAGGGKVDVLEVKSVPVPVPDWVVSWVNALAGQQVDASGATSTLPMGEVLRIKERVFQSYADDYYTRLARWFFSDRSMRKPAPDGSEVP